MTKELIENIRTIIVPYMAHDLRRINYENMGEIDAEQFKEDMNEILDLATKALQQQPCEDCISRQAAIDAILKIHPVDTEYDCTLYDKVDVMYVLKDLSPVNPQEPKTGHWITTRTFMHDGEFYCDRCKCDSPNNKKWDYCPNCGAKMVESNMLEIPTGLESEE